MNNYCEPCSRDVFKSYVKSIDISYRYDLYISPSSDAN